MYEKAKAIVVVKPRCAEVQEIPLPQVDEQSVVVRTTYSGISMGTEMKVWSGLSGHLGGELWYPLIPGYEEVGEVVHVGPKAKKTFAGETLKVGDRVMANELRYFPEHCHAWGGQVGVAVNNPRTSPSPFDWPARIPDNVSYPEAVIAYLATVAEKGINRVQPKPGQTILVIGAGMVGVSWMQLAKLAGCRVIAMEVNRKRCELAARFCDEMIDVHRDDPLARLKQLTNDKMADIIVECSGNAAVVTELHKYLRDGGWAVDEPFGHIHLQGDYPWPVIIQPYQNWFTKNMNISLTCALRPGGKERILQLISEGKFDAKTLLQSPLTVEVPVDESPKAYHMAEESNKDIFKVIFKW
ncbi:MAG: zinc-binding dehydrogenase [Phycisphaerae bacterium]|nr:zinc-binding dehydrogenase [Phycisphaerae bacterium]